MDRRSAGRWFSGIIPGFRGRIHGSPSATGRICRRHTSLGRCSRRSIRFPWSWARRCCWNISDRFARLAMAADGDPVPVAEEPEEEGGEGGEDLRSRQSSLRPYRLWCRRCPPSSRGVPLGTEGGRIGTGQGGGERQRRCALRPLQMEPAGSEPRASARPGLFLERVSSALPVTLPWPVAGAGNGCRRRAAARPSGAGFEERNRWRCEGDSGGGSRTGGGLRDAVALPAAPWRSRGSGPPPRSPYARADAESLRCESLSSKPCWRPD